jgi:signal transduction histidine kinase/CheY-like chemotaxis protein
MSDVARTGSTAATDADIRAERVKSVFEQTPVTALVTVVNAVLMAVALAGAADERRVFAWVAAVVALTALRLALWRAYRRTPPGYARRWAVIATCGALVSGLLWGAGAILLSPPSETFQLLWVLLIGGMCAGAAVFHAAHLPTALAYIVPAILPLAVRFAAGGSERRVATTAMVLVFLAALVTMTRRASRRFGDVLRLQFDLARRTRDLDAMNGRLRAEMAEHRATETALRHAQRMEAVGQLTGGIAHDFNNLLTAVLGSLDLLRKRLPSDDQQAMRLLDNAVQGAERGAALTQRLLAFGRGQALKPEAVDLPALVHGMSGLLRSSLGAGIRVETRFPMGLAAAHVDAHQLELALLNLVVNARDAIEQSSIRRREAGGADRAGGGDITIAAHEEQVHPGEESGLPPGPYVVLSVADTGTGMDETTLARAVEPFFTTKGVGKGTGLGLSMVHGLAAQSGGRLALRSREGEGTTAELWLQRAEIAAQPPPLAPEPVQTRVARSRTVLLVDDDPLVLASATAMVEDLGHAAVEAASGREALEIVRGGASVDLVITDYAMPGMSGVQLADELHRLRPGLALLLATGHPGLRGAATSGLARLNKPFGREALARAIEGCAGAGAQIEPFSRN